MTYEMKCAPSEDSDQSVQSSQSLRLALCLVRIDKNEDELT